MILADTETKPFNFEAELEKIAFEHLSGLNFDETCNLHGVSSLDELAELSGFFKKLKKKIKKVVKKVAKVVKKVAPIALGVVGATMIPGVGGLLAKGASFIGGALKKVAGSGAAKTVTQYAGSAINASGQIVGNIVDAAGNVIDGTGRVLGNVNQMSSPYGNPYADPNMVNNALPMMQLMMQQQGIAAESKQATDLLKQELEQQRLALADQANKMQLAQQQAEQRSREQTSQIMYAMEQKAQKKEEPSSMEKNMPLIMIGGFAFLMLTMMMTQQRR